MAQKFDDSEGVWRTIGGRRVFIKTGQSLADAMIESGKFKNIRSEYRKAKEEIKEEEDKNEEPEKKKLMGHRINEETGKKELYEYTEEDNELGHWEKDNNGNRVFVKNPRYKEETAKDLDEELRKKEDKYLSSDKGVSEQEKEQQEIKELHDKLKEKAKEEGYDTEKTNWRDDLKAKQEVVNKSIEENQNQTNEKYATAKHEGFGDYNKDNIPVYDNKIDYTGDFGRNANLSSLSDKELNEAIKVQSEQLSKAKSENVGDLRTRNGKMAKIFKTARVQQYEQGVELLKQEAINRENKKYPQYAEKGYGVKYYSAEDVMNDPNSAMNTYIKEQAEKKAYKKYLKQHPNSTISLDEFKKNKKK